MSYIQFIYNYIMCAGKGDGCCMNININEIEKWQGISFI